MPVINSLSAGPAMGSQALWAFYYGVGSSVWLDTSNLYSHTGCKVNRLKRCSFKDKSFFISKKKIKKKKSGYTADRTQVKSLEVAFTQPARLLTT